MRHLVQWIWYDPSLHRAGHTVAFYLHQWGTWHVLRYTVTKGVL